MRDSRTVWSGLPVAVTGAAGFLGSHLVPRLLQLGAKVRALDAFLPGTGAHPVPFPVHRAEIREAAAETVAGARVVFHLAAPSGHRASMEQPHRDYRHGVEAVLDLLESIRHHAPRARLVFTSTRQNYRIPTRLPVGEDAPLDPPDVHGVHKELAEHLVRQLASDWAILRLTNCYGPRQPLRGPAAGFTGSALDHALAGQPIPILGDGDLLRDFNHADDVVEALLRAGDPEAASAVWNLGGPPVRLVDFAATVWAALGQPPQLKFHLMPADLGAIAVGDIHSDWSRIQTDLGWRPKVHLHDGIARTVAAFRASGV